MCKFRGLHLSASQRQKLCFRFQIALLLQCRKGSSCILTFHFVYQPTSPACAHRCTAPSPDPQTGVAVPPRLRRPSGRSNRCECYPRFLAVRYRRCRAAGSQRGRQARQGRLVCVPARPTCSVVALPVGTKSRERWRHERKVTPGVDIYNLPEGCQREDSP